MKIAIVISTIVTLLLSVTCFAESYRGHIAFFYIEKNHEQAAYEDFIYYYKKIKGKLESNGFSVSLHNEKPIEIQTRNSKRIVVPEKDLKNGIGYICINTNGTHKLYFGVHTDIDLLFEIEDFFGVKTDT